MAGNEGEILAQQVSSPDGVAYGGKAPKFRIRNLLKWLARLFSLSILIFLSMFFDQMIRAFFSSLLSYLFL